MTEQLSLSQAIKRNHWQLLSILLWWIYYFIYFQYLLSYYFFSRLLSSQNLNISFWRSLERRKITRYYLGWNSRNVMMISFPSLTLVFIKFVKSTNDKSWTVIIRIPSSHNKSKFSKKKTKKQQLERYN